MKSKQEGFLALEAVVALAIVCIARTAAVTCLSGLKKLEQESRYVLTGKGDLYDETQQKICQK